MSREQYLYRLTLIPRLLDEKEWTGKENGIISDHFKYLQGLLAAGSLILAGRTEISPEGFGIVIFEAQSRRQAEEIMLNDPAVAEGIMTARLFPYRLALIRE